MNFTKIFWLIFAAALAAGLYYYLMSWTGGPGAQPSVEAKKVPEFTFQDYSGLSVSTADYGGKLLILNVWASWCPFCKKELQDLAVLKEEFGERITVVAVNRGETPEIARGYSDSLGLTGVAFVLDPSDTFYKAINGFSMPETVFADKDGIVRFHKRGPMELEEMRRRVEDIL